MSPILKRSIAEAVGTFSLTLAVSVTLMYPSVIPTPVAAALTLGLFVYMIGSISGAHLNPAVTIAVSTLGKMNPQEAVTYILAQFMGALFSPIVLRAIGLSAGGLTVTNTLSVGVFEMIGAFFLMFGVSSLVFDKTPKEASGAVVGGSLLLGITIASLGSNGILNPAVGLGIRSVSLMYLVAPVLGAVLAAQLYKVIATK